jgi:hypothetical protein
MILPFLGRRLLQGLLALVGVVRGTGVVTSKAEAGLCTFTSLRSLLLLLRLLLVWLHGLVEWLRLRLLLFIARVHDEGVACGLVLSDAKCGEPKLKSVLLCTTWV